MPGSLHSYELQRRMEELDDVSSLENYLSCYMETKSEIVVLIRDEDRILCQIDVDSRALARFSVEDERLLDELAGLIAGRWAERPQP